MNKKSILLTSVFLLATAGSSYGKIALKSDPDTKAPAVVGDSQSNAGVTDPDSLNYISGVSETDSTAYVKALLDEPTGDANQAADSYDAEEDEDDVATTVHPYDADNFIDTLPTEEDVLDEETLKKIFNVDDLADKEASASVKMHSQSIQTSYVDGKEESTSHEEVVDASMLPSGKWAIDESSKTAKNGKVTKATRSKWVK